MENKLVVTNGEGGSIGVEDWAVQIVMYQISYKDICTAYGL